MSNVITIKNNKGKDSCFDVLFTVEADNINYVVFSNKKVSKDGSVSTYFAKYEKNKNVLKNVNKKEEGYLNEILSKF